MSKEKLFLLDEELDKWNSVKYRINEEGIEYCFKHYSDFSDINDNEFHRIRIKLLDSIKEMEEYVQTKINETEDKISELE